MAVCHVGSASTSATQAQKLCDVRKAGHEMQWRQVKQCSTNNRRSFLMQGLLHDRCSGGAQCCSLCQRAHGNDVAGCPFIQGLAALLHPEHGAVIANLHGKLPPVVRSVCCAAPIMSPLPEDTGSCSRPDYHQGFTWLCKAPLAACAFWVANISIAPGFPSRSWSC